MGYEQYRYVFIVAAILSAVFFAASIIIFFALDIRNAIGYVTGINARNAIKKIRQSNMNSGNTGDVGSSANKSVNTGIITEKISTQILTNDETTILNTSDSNETTVLYQTEGADRFFEIEYDITFIHTSEVIT